MSKRESRHPTKVSGPQKKHRGAETPHPDRIDFCSVADGRQGLAGRPFDPIAMPAPMPAPIRAVVASTG